MGALQIAERFRAPPAWNPKIAVERRFIEREPAQAAVLMPLVQRDELMVLLTRRTDHLHDHPGQVSFPGGRVDPEDRDVVDTALRESLEEIGLHPRHVQVIGQMPTYTTGSGFVVTPVVALVEPTFTLALDAFEVADVFEVPLSFLMTPAQPPLACRRARRRAPRVSVDAVGRSGQRRRSRGDFSSGARPPRCCAICTAS